MTNEIANLLRRNWAERDRHESVLLDSLDEHLPMLPKAGPLSSGVSSIPITSKSEPVGDVVLFPVYSLIPRQVNLATYSRESP